MKYLITLLSILFLISCEPQEKELNQFHYSYTASTTDGGVVKITQTIMTSAGIVFKNKPGELEVIQSLPTRSVVDNCNVLLQDISDDATISVWKDGKLLKKCSKSN